MPEPPGRVGVGAAPAGADRGLSDPRLLNGARGLLRSPAADAGGDILPALPEAGGTSPPASRFVRRNIAGAPQVHLRAAIPAEAYRQRAARLSGAPGAARGGGRQSQTEEAIELGLAFLARYQLADGSWSLESFAEEVSLASDTAATGLALLAFQGAGYNHLQHEHAPTVARGLRHLLRHQKQDGDLFVPADEISNRSVWLYSHSIAALALCEAFGMTQDPQLREPAQRAIHFIVEAQDRDYGGWRYAPGVGSDTSVTGGMMLALKSGELAGLEAPSQTYDLIRRWLEFSQASSAEQHLYRYNPFAPDTPSQRHGRQPSRTMTAVGLLMRLCDGWRRDHEVMVRGADYLRQNLPALGTPEAPERDTYYWYYGTQVMFHMGGKYWEDWNGRLHPLLVNSQVKVGSMAGSWHPLLPLPDRWGPHAGRLYVTAMNLLSLEVTYRHLPLYENTAR